MGGPSRLSSGKFKCCFSNNWYPRYRRVARPPLEGCAIPLLNDSQWCCDVKWQENDNAMRSRRNASGAVRADDLEHWTRDAQKEFAQNLFIAIEVTHQPIHSHHRASKNRTRFYNRHLSVSLWEKQKNTCSLGGAGRLGGGRRPAPSRRPRGATGANGNRRAQRWLWRARRRVGCWSQRPPHSGRSALAVSCSKVAPGAFSYGSRGAAVEVAIALIGRNAIARRTLRAYLPGLLDRALIAPIGAHTASSRASLWALCSLAPGCLGALAELSATPRLLHALVGEVRAATTRRTPPQGGCKPLIAPPSERDATSTIRRR